MEKVLRSSEFWVALLVPMGLAGVQMQWWTHDDFEGYVKPAIMYVIARLISKAAKGAPAKVFNDKEVK